MHEFRHLFGQGLLSCSPLRIRLYDTSFQSNVEEAGRGYYTPGAVA